MAHEGEEEDPVVSDVGPELGQVTKKCIPERQTMKVVTNIVVYFNYVLKLYLRGLNFRSAILCVRSWLSIFLISKGLRSDERRRKCCFQVLEPA